MALKNSKKVKIYSRYSRKSMYLWASAFAIIGVITLIATRAATPLTLDTTLPQPQNVRTYPDDRFITVAWDNVSNSRVVGYYLTYKKRGTTEEYKVRQTTHNIIQIQPVENGVEYEINVQSASGNYAVSSAGNLVHGGSQNSFARGDGRVSNKTTVFASGNSARVDAMRQRLTGFFDDFNTAAGPFDELKWNQATTSCAQPGTAAAFINPQFHSHNMIRSDGECDRGGMVTRPRANFDISSATEANPAQIEFDVDGATHGRDTWYLDVMPLSARSNRLPLDITSHNSIFDDDTEGPGNMIRFNARPDELSVTYYDNNLNPSALNLFTAPTACSKTNWLSDPNSRVGYDFNCDASQKTPGLNPLQPIVHDNLAPIPNVRRHWVIQFTPTKIKVFIDSTLVAVANMPAQFYAEKVYTVHSTVFTYSTGKDTWPGDGVVTPYVQLLHWDNFGFTGPAPTEVIHNYLEGGATGNQPVYGIGTDSYQIPTGNRTTIIKMPDQVGTLKDGVGRLFFTLNDNGSKGYKWVSGDHIIFNGKRYNVPNPQSLTGKTRAPLPDSERYVPLAIAMNINQSDIKQGDNVVTFNLNGGPAFFPSGYDYPTGQADTMNVHLELPYASNGPIPSYTSPFALFNTTFGSMFQPSITNCDQYRYVEQDLNLPYESGKTNISAGQCALLPATIHSHVPPTGGGTNTPPTDSTAPTATMTAPANNTSFTSGNIEFRATATDNIAVGRVEFFVDGISVGSSSSPVSGTYVLSVSASSIVNGSHSVYAVAYDTSNNRSPNSASTTFTVSIATPPSSTKFTTLGVNATLPNEDVCSTRVRVAGETRPSNANFNTTRGTSPNNENPRVTGNFVGTTDQIIQWASCKWGMDEDLLRAQAAIESYWFQNAGGDLSTDANSCTPVYPIGTYNGQSGVCPESVGLLQVRWLYHPTAFEDNNAVYSTAYNVDYYASVWRRCYNGEYTWLNSVERGADYGPGDERGCLGLWFAGRWRTAPALEYMSRVQDYLTQKIWETSSFVGATPPTNTPGFPADTTNPTISLTSPTPSSSVSGTITISANASDTQSAIASVSYYLDSATTPFSVDVTSPYNSSWNTASVPNGSHTIRAVARDTAGREGSTTVTFTVNNTVADTTDPTTSITDPRNGATVNGTKVVLATASDNVGIARVELLIDGTVRATDTTSPYSFNWITTDYTDGAHTIQTQAYDSSGRRGTSSTLTITVRNTTTPPPTPKPGDVGGDGVVDGRDASVVLFNWNKTGLTRAQGDLNNDGVVNAFDISIILFNWGK